jgi:hypothetical protein
MFGDDAAQRSEAPDESAALVCVSRAVVWRGFAGEPLDIGRMNAQAPERILGEASGKAEAAIKGG